jgi:hypothetical protein
MKIDKPTIEKMGTDLKGKLERYKADRVASERQWLKNLRQYRGVYDPDILGRIPEDKSRAYPRDTRLKVKAFVAKMMEMMFPASEQNWELELSPIPSVPQEDVDKIIKGLEAQEAIVAQEEGRPPQPVPSEDIEEAVRKLADERRMVMQKKILDQLHDAPEEWPQIAKRTVRSGAIFGWGVIKSPMVRTQKERVWEPNKAGKYEAKTVSEKRPYPEFVKIWDVYPDMTAPNWDEQEGLFERLVFSRKGFADLKKRPGFIKENISDYLRLHMQGNFKPEPFEADLNDLSNSKDALGNREGRRYAAYRWFGYSSAHDLAKLGVEIPEKDMDKNVLSDIWFIEDTIIYANTAPFGDKISDVYHSYIYAEDEEAGLTGIGMPEELRDRQMAICSGTRALYDNMAASAGPVYEVAVDMLKNPQQAKHITAFSVIEREGFGEELQHPAVRPVHHEPIIQSVMGILEVEREQFDLESNIPSWTLGNPQPLGEAFRTSRNMSQMAGGANMVTKDNVRAFDKFTTSFITSMLDWNMEFLDDDDAKGDFQVKAKGNISLVAREVRGAALDQLVTTLSPQEAAIVKTRDILIERLKSRDLPIDIVEDEEAAAQILQSMAEAESQARQIEQGLTQAQTAKAGASAQKDSAAAERTSTMTQAEVDQIYAQIDSLRQNARSDKKRLQLDVLEQMFNNLLGDQNVR